MLYCEEPRTHESLITLSFFPSRMGAKKNAESLETLQNSLRLEWTLRAERGKWIESIQSGE